MKERTFIINNKELWGQIEKKVNQNSYRNPNDITADYLRITEDLAFARTYYPKSSLIEYLNSLSASLHQIINIGEKHTLKEASILFLESIPLAIKEIYKTINYTTLFFVVMCVLGFVSAMHDSDFASLILGDRYINMTAENIASGDPLGVYSNMDSGMMTFLIGTNNISVALRAFSYGIFAGFGSVYILMLNGIMVGAFIELFRDPELLGLAFTTIMLHGTIELWLIIVSGAAGIHFGWSVIFPGTYPRLYALKMAAIRAIKVLIGCIPFFVLAAIIESYVTRHYMALGYGGRLFIIVLSVVLIYSYFYYLPSKIYLKKEAR